MEKHSVVVIGDCKAGKTALLQRHFMETFIDWYFTTSGVDFLVRKLTRNEKKSLVLFWDTSGLDKELDETTSRYGGAVAFIIVFDLTNEASLNSVENKWVGLIKEHNKKENLDILLVGTKSDLTDSRVVTEERGKKVAEKIGAQYFETSSKDDVNVDKVFEALFKAVTTPKPEEAQSKPAPNTSTPKPKPVTEDVIGSTAADTESERDLSMETADERHKILVIGSQGVGKTALVQRYYSDVFNEAYEPTIGIAYATKNTDKGDQIWNLQTWDTSGQERYQLISKEYFPGASGFIVVYDITKPETFLAVKDTWLGMIEELSDKEMSDNIVLVGNKSDLVADRVISQDQGKRLASEIGGTYIEVSCKKDVNVDEAYDALMELISSPPKPKIKLPVIPKPEPEEEEKKEPVEPEQVEEELDEDEIENAEMHKILVIGDSSVGKTALVQQYYSDIFPEKYDATIGIDYESKYLKRHDKPWNLQTWDTSGQERYDAISKEYYPGASGFIVVYDITNEASFNAVKEKWVDLIQKNADVDSRGTIVLVGHKSDLNGNRVITEAQGKALAEEIGALYFETSSKNNVNVDEVFEGLMDLISPPPKPPAKPAGEKPEPTEQGEQPKPPAENGAEGEKPGTKPEESGVSVEPPPTANNGDETAPQNGADGEKPAGEGAQNGEKTEASLEPTEQIIPTNQKILLLGDVAVGKTSLAQRYKHDTFSEKFVSTVGIDYYSKTLTRGDIDYRLSIWDLAGQERYLSIGKAYFHGAHVFVIVYDITNEDSFKKAKETWLKLVEEYEEKANYKTKKVLVGHKSDLADSRVISEEQGKKFAEEIGGRYLETSSKNDVNVDEVFEVLFAPTSPPQTAAPSKEDKESQKPSAENSQPPAENGSEGEKPGKKPEESGVSVEPPPVAGKEENGAPQNGEKKPEESGISVEPPPTANNGKEGAPENGAPQNGEKTESPDVPPPEPPNLDQKIVVLGDSGVGKTNLIYKYADDIFNAASKPTVGIDFKQLLDVKRGDNTFRLKIWDTSGNEIYLSITKAYFNGTTGWVIVYDITNEDSFKNTKENWLKYVKEHEDKANTKARKVLVGHKSDLAGSRVISEEQGKKLAEEMGGRYIETSSKNDVNVDEVFEFFMATTSPPQTAAPSKEDKESQKPSAENGQPPAGNGLEGEKPGKKPEESGVSVEPPPTTNNGKEGAPQNGAPPNDEKKPKESGISVKPPPIAGKEENGEPQNRAPQNDEKKPKETGISVEPPPTANNGKEGAPENGAPQNGVSQNETKTESPDVPAPEPPKLFQKIVLLGNSGVGKTNLMFKYTEDHFTEEFVSTVGIDFKEKKVTRGDNTFTLRIWDTAGQERYLSITKAYFRGTTGFVILYDITNEESFRNAKENWLKLVKEHEDKDNTKARKVLVGHKSDLAGSRVISEEQGKKLAEEMGGQYLETSSKNDVNVDEVFEFFMATTSPPQTAAPSKEDKESQKPSAENSEPPAGNGLEGEKPGKKPEESGISVEPPPIAGKEENGAPQNGKPPTTNNGKEGEPQNGAPQNGEKTESPAVPSPEPPRLNQKIVLIGDTQVGKTNLILRYADDVFNASSVVTVGIDYKKVTKTRGDNTFNLQLWDTAGQERYLSITKAYYHGASGFVIMYDITNEDSFKNAKENWLKYVEEYEDKAKYKAKKVLVGHKSDLAGSRVVSEEQGKKLAEEMGGQYIETSSKNDVNVDEVFEPFITPTSPPQTAAPSKEEKESQKPSAENSQPPAENGSEGEKPGKKPEESGISVEPPPTANNGKEGAPQNGAPQNGAPQNGEKKPEKSGVSVEPPPIAGKEENGAPQNGEKKPEESGISVEPPPTANNGKEGAPQNGAPQNGKLQNEEKTESPAVPPPEPPKLLQKIMVLGDTQVGKTNLIFKYIDDVFNAASTPTVGIDFGVKKLTRGDNNFRLNIWDTAGQERFLMITKAYFRGAAGFVIVYDITNEESFRNAKEKWLKLVKEEEDRANSKVKKVLVGHKSDLAGSRVISEEQGKKLAEKMGGQYIETSSKNDVNVDEVFEFFITPTSPPQTAAPSKEDKESQKSSAENGQPPAENGSEGEKPGKKPEESGVSVEPPPTTNNGKEGAPQNGVNGEKPEESGISVKPPPIANNGKEGAPQNEAPPNDEKKPKESGISVEPPPIAGGSPNGVTESKPVTEQKMILIGDCMFGVASVTAIPITEAQSKKLAEQIGVSSLEASAIQSVNVDKAVDALKELLKEKQAQDEKAGKKCHTC